MMTTKTKYTYSLHRASNELDLEAVRRFLARGDNVNGRVEGDTPIHGVLRKRRTVSVDHRPALRTEILQELLNAGAHINSDSPGGLTALHLACQLKLTDVVQFLVSNGADVNMFTDFLESPLLCVFTNDKDADELLSQHREWCDQGGAGECTECRSPERYTGREMPFLTFKRFIRVTEVARALLDGGADPSAQSLLTDEEFSPLHYACRYPDEDLIKLLIEKGANVMARNACGDTPLHTLLKMEVENMYMGILSVSPDVLSAFLQAGFDLRTHGEDECSVLHYACQSADPASVLLLISQGADVQAVNADGNTPLHCVVPKKNDLRSVFNSGGWVVPGVKDPNMAAIIAGHLLDAGAEIEAKNLLDQTPLIKVCCGGGGFCCVVQVLVARGADETGLHALCSNDDRQGLVGETYFHRVCTAGGARLVGRLCDLGITLPTVLPPPAILPETSMGSLRPSLVSIWEDMAVVVVLGQAGVDCTDMIHDRAVRFLWSSEVDLNFVSEFEGIFDFLLSREVRSDDQVRFFSAYTTFVYAVNPVNEASNRLVLEESSRDPRLAGFTEELQDRMVTPASLQRQAVYVIRRILGGSVSGRRRSVLPCISALGDVRPPILPSHLVDMLRLSAETDTLLALIKSLLVSPCELDKMPV